MICNPQFFISSLSVMCKECTVDLWIIVQHFINTLKIKINFYEKNSSLLHNSQICEDLAVFILVCFFLIRVLIFLFYLSADYKNAALASRKNITCKESQKFKSVYFLSLKPIPWSCVVVFWWFLCFVFCWFFFLSVKILWFLNLNYLGEKTLEGNSQTVETLFFG